MSINSITAGQTGTSTNASVAILVGRVLLSALFILAGFGKLTAIVGHRRMVRLASACPFRPSPWWSSASSNWLAALPSSSATRPASPRSWSPLFTLGATAIAHLDFADQMQVLMLQKNLAITGGLLILAVVGAGALSIDARRS